MLNVNIGKVRTIKLSDYFEYKKTEYCYIKLVPIKSNKNNNINSICSFVSKCHSK